MAAGIAGIQRLGKAEPGDKTMLDALLPARDALRGGLDRGDAPADALAAAVAAAEQGMLATIPLRRPQGSGELPVGERSAGHQDPGATSFASPAPRPLPTHAFLRLRHPHHTHGSNNPHDEATSAPSTRAPPARASWSSTGPARSSPSTRGSTSRSFRSPAGSSTTPRRSGPRRQVISDALAKAASRPPTSPPSASPTSARPPSSGTARTGRAGAQRDRLAGHAHRRARRRARRATRPGPLPREDRPAAGDLLLRRPRSRWILDNVAGAARKRPRPANCCSAPSTPGYLEPHRRRRRRLHVTDVTNASRTHADEPRDPGLGRGASGLFGIPRAHAAARSAPRSEVYGTIGRRRSRGRAARRHPRRSAGRPVRPDLLRGRARPRTPTAPAASCC